MEEEELPAKKRKKGVAVAEEVMEVESGVDSKINGGSAKKEKKRRKKKHSQNETEPTDVER